MKRKSAKKRERTFNGGGKRFRLDSAATREIPAKMKKKLMKYEALPDYLKDNEFIVDYYRCEWPLKDTFLSVFSWHNETLNIWTHLGGFLIFATMMVASFTDNTKGDCPISTFFRTSAVATTMMAMFALDSTKGSRNASPSLAVLTDYSSLRIGIFRSGRSFYVHVILHVVWAATQFGNFPKPSLFDIINDNGSTLIPEWPWFVFLAGAMCCLVFSSISHLLACHSKRLNLFFWRLDYAGISVMIVSSFFAPIYYGFYCQPFWSVLYLSSITTLGILAIVTLLAPSLSSPHFRAFRASLFFAMGISGVIPAVHAAVLHSGDPQVLVALGLEIIMGILYGIGVGFYVTRIPERWKPGLFDLTGHSHQIFHVFVVGGALVHSVAILTILDWRRNFPICS